MKNTKLDLQKFGKEAVAGLLSKGTKLSYKTGDGPTKEVAAVKSIPALGSDPEKIEVTHLGSDRKSYIKGIQDSDNLEFAIVYQGANFKDIYELVKKGETVEWTIEFPDKLKAEFTGTPAFKFDGVEVNQALGFNLVVVVSKGPDFTPAP